MPKMLKLQICPPIPISHTELQLHPAEDSSSPGCWHVLGMSSPAQHEGPVEIEKPQEHSPGFYFFQPFQCMLVTSRLRKGESADKHGLQTQSAIIIRKGSYGLLSGQ